MQARPALQHLDGALVLDGDERRLLALVDGSEPPSVRRVALPEGRLVAIARFEADALQIPLYAPDEHRTVAVLGIDHLARRKRR